MYGQRWSYTSDECKKYDCSCQKTGTLCGRSMQPGCNVSSHSIYDCTGGIGSTPALQELCVPGSTCTEYTDGASCGGVKCTCTGDLSVCSSQFLEGCNLKKNALYKYTPSGRPVLDKIRSKDRPYAEVLLRTDVDWKSARFTSAQQSDPLPCSSRNARMVNVRLKWVPTAVAQLPIPLPAASATARPRSADPASTPSAISSLEDLSIPTVSTPAQAMDKKPVKGATCTMDEVCAVESAGAQCKSLCICTGSEKKCSKEFPAACHLLIGVFRCGADSKPEKVKDCPEGSICVGGASGSLCISPECAYKNNNSRCGSSFDEKCGYEKNDVYSCVKDDVPVRVNGCGKVICSSSVLPPDLPHSVSDFCIKQCHCKEFDTACAMYRDRLNGDLGDFIQLLQDNIGALPIIGPLILSPLLGVLKTLVIALQQDLATSTGGVIAILYGILQVVNIISPADQMNVIRDYLLRLVGLPAIPTECGGSGRPSSGLIKIVRMMADAVVALVSAIPVFGAGIGLVLNPLLDGLFAALTLGSSAAINASYGLLSGALSVVEIMPYFGNIAIPFRYLLEATKNVVDCLAVGTDSNATITTKLELIDGSEVGMRLPGAAGQQEQQQQVFEKPESMLAEI
ncbi:hypothetical protein BGW39_006089 [Mortierella sp. 14UC]|nr:hypothetical protein BGW39_006089 [Mortierella sp. 14UC]